ncbi:hypothetical protein [Marinoscillum sp.]|uniref:hypothetical protein n=1 Tax=Marinoscillum sp. TaxID=2024838 RepID=UPI003BAD06D7
MDILFGVILEVLFLGWFKRAHNPFHKVFVVLACLLFAVVLAVIAYAMVASFT